MKHKLLVALGAFFYAATVSAQHEHHNMPVKDTVPAKHKMEVDHTDSTHPHPMSHAYSLHLPMNRNASGTAWLPDATPMYMYMGGKKTMWMIHGSVFLRYSHTDVFKSGSKGAGKFGTPNWVMGMVNRRVGKKGLLTGKLMISLDRLTEGGNGYPLLFQSGETYEGRPLIDRQHPHDLFAELSAGYTYSFNKKTDAFIYIGYPGEPALSAPAFMHRISSLNNPDAPLGHHWQDATHITFGVATVGIRYDAFKLEGSAFNGREPDEERYGFDPLRFNSYSMRLSYNPSPFWAMQLSRAQIKSPELLAPGIDISRTTASVLFARPFHNRAHLNSALIWGLNDKGADHLEHAILQENNYQFGKQAIYNRYEWVQKSADELGLEEELGHEKFGIHAFTAGYNRELWQWGPIVLAAGAQATINLPAKELQGIYGKMPVGMQLYLQLRPAQNR